MENNDKAPEIFTSLDLEMNQPTGKIIQIGAVVGNLKTGEIIDKLSIIVNPHETLGVCEDSKVHITDLTGITQEQVDKGLELIDAFDVLRTFHEKYGSFINPVTWGGGDAEEIRNQLKSMYTIERIGRWPFGRRWIDAKTYYVGYRAIMGKQLAGGLAKAMTKVGLKFEGRKHNALDDAFNTFKMFRRLLKLFKPFEQGDFNE
jgi:sporulation inhibitor KapD